MGVRVVLAVINMLDTIVLASLADHGYSGKQRVVTVDQNTTGIGGLLSLSADGHYDDADKGTGAKCRVIALESGTGSKLVGDSPGYMRDDSWNWTPGVDLFVGDDGAITATPPSGGDYSQKIGYAETADIAKIEISPEMFQTVAD